MPPATTRSVLHEAGGSPLHRCGLVAEDRATGRCRGFWTDDPAMAADFIASVEATFTPDTAGNAPE